LKDRSLDPLYVKDRYHAQNFTDYFDDSKNHATQTSEAKDKAAAGTSGDESTAGKRP